MAKAQVKTTENDASVEAFIAARPEAVAADCRTLIALMRKATGEEPRMWGTAIVGFGRYPYKGASGREGEWMVIGFSPRKANLSLYLFVDFHKEAALMAKLGKHSTGKGCLYIKRLSDVDGKVLEQLIVNRVKAMAAQRIM